MRTTPQILARGPWDAAQVRCVWQEEPFQPGSELTRAADAALDELRERGSPSHDGLSARLAGYREENGALHVELQPARWALRLIDDAARSMAALCVARDADGRWLAGRRAPWVASWAGRWALGAGGAVEVGESPIETLSRELEEEWGVTPERLAVEALLLVPRELVLFIGQAWLPAGAEVRRDAEHDAHAWWPADVSAWPREGDAPLRNLAALVGG